MSLVAAKGNFLLKVRLLVVLPLKLLLRKFLRSRVQEEVVVIVVMLRFSKRERKKNLIMYMYRLLAFEV